MRVLILLFLITVATQSAPAQTHLPGQSPPDVVIASFDFGTITYVSDDRRSLGGGAIQFPPRAEDRIEPRLNRPTSYPDKVSFRYAFLDVSNRGTKSVKAIEWDFAFPRVVNHRAVPRHGVSSKVKIAPGETKTLKASLPRNRQPRCGATVIMRGVLLPSSSGNPDCDVLRSMTINNFQERVSIKRVEYSDGSVWQRP